MNDKIKIFNRFKTAQMKFIMLKLLYNDIFNNNKKNWKS